MKWEVYMVHQDYYCVTVEADSRLAAEETALSRIGD
jgi:hypothetical protein